MTIGTISGTTITGSGSSTDSLTGSHQTIAQNFNTFLQLLTTQLKNQNPLDPLNTNQFTQQLVQFSGVEQQLKTNDFLKNLMLSSQTTTASQAVSFVGKQVTASTTNAQLQNGKATWVFNVAEPASNATITIKDKSGNTVYTTTGSLSQGDVQFSWDGVDSTGNQLSDGGTYQIQVDAKNGNGQHVKVTTQAAGIVSSVDFSGSEPYLIMGNQRIALSSVESVTQPSS